MQREVIVSVSDVRYVCIACPICHSKVILDMKQKSALAERNGFFAPKECPGCRTDYDSAMRRAVDSLQSAYRSLLDFSGAITFHGDSAAPGPPEKSQEPLRSN